MSQAGIINVAGGGGGGSPIQSVETDDGTATPIANEIIISGNDTTENDDDGLRTVGGGEGGTAANEVRVEITNRLQGTAQSAAGSNADIITFPLSDNFVYRFRFDVTGKSTGGSFIGQGVGYTIFGTAKRAGAGAVVVSVPFIDTDEDTNLISSSISFIPSGNNVILRAVGTATETVSYGAVGYYVVV